MTTLSGKKRVFSIPAGAPFLKTVAQTLCDGRLNETFRYDAADPLSLADVTIYVPTRRSARVLRSEFVDLLGGRSAILPVIRPLGETDDDSGYFDLVAPEEMDLALPIGGTARLLELGRLILAWRNQLPKIVLDVHSESPLVAPASPADAIWLARALAELIDAVETEERDWADLKKLDTGEHALWWQLTAEFLSIASAFWPIRLEELRRSSPAKHQAAILRGEARRISSRDHKGPVIVAGSTGSVPAAADLIAAISNLPNGTVVLPGLDLSMPADQWAMIGEEAFDGKPEPASRSHSQFGLSRLLKKLGVMREDVEVLGEVPDDLAFRAEALSQALVPAKATDRWSTWRDSADPSLLAQAFADVSLIEASNEREEAVAIAIALRLALEQPGRQGGESQAALITPDRALARRVTAELSRFGLLADDSAGSPLSGTPQGTLAQLLLEATLRPGDPVAIVALIKHPLMRLGLPAAELRSAVEALEILALRGGLGDMDISALEPLLEIQLAAQLEDRHAPRWRLSLPADAAGRARDLAHRLANAVEPLASALVRRRPDGRGLTAKLTLSEWAERTGRALEAICIDERRDLAALWSGEAGERLAGLLSEVIDTDGQMEADGPQWIDIVMALTTGEAVKPRSLSHPRIFIFGTLEARLQSVDTMILGGLNEGSWPGQTVNNPFLSRTMKTDMGLEPPERRIGQLAHDFEMACGTRHLILSRSMRQGSTPTVASRWLQRLLALGGRQFADDLRTRGHQYRDWASMIDAGENQPVARRPAPKPPADLHPTKYSFSEVGRLRRDPYSIYARRILKLDPLAPFNRDPGASERGTLYHAIIDRYTREGHKPGTPAAREAMRRITEELFDAEQLPTHIDRVWRPRFVEVARAFLDWEVERAPDIRRTMTEVGAGWELEPAGIRVTGIADRIDIKGSGLADLIDYKTGLNPSVSQARALLDPQLGLEAAALRAGAFKDAGPLTPDQLLYVRLRPGDRFREDKVNNEGSSATAKRQPKSAIDLADESIEQLTRFVITLRNGEAGFASRLVPMAQNDFGGEYDHLARVAEWSTADDEEAEADE
ncbi:Double-strand break repair protein AddB [Neorhizobium galegae bv. officinalis bv. officinalis str. HAMBI 1141]|uniref:Double-strand break repair protein AddB n=1 Tax=Neorhizobium galegae bv. officinalis bv. officinalis str. HAMBI 1141 TaxID=1028801 RepID=A0A068TE66_NEOGA|nr:double-strand break repair protein AddB [Neorhizobium galegae]CDN56331.1 Double-strand break repair protein AddB [Neorhizobium galegae bv. officinalis bv. officinalis str. HAMBI 1141]